MLFVKRLRHVGIYTVAVSTAALAGAFVLSTAVLYIAGRLMKTQRPTWYGLSLVVAYLLSIGLGGVVGGVTGFLTSHKLLRSR